MPDCEVCRRPEKETPSIFKQERWCSDNCRKVITGELPNPIQITVTREE